MTNTNIRGEIDEVIGALKASGIGHDTSPDTVQGLGDLVEGVLNKFGITQERYKEFFNLKECNCTERKKFLNGLLSWHIKSKE